MTEVQKFYHSLLQDIKTEAIASEEGGFYESLFTRYAMELLSESGETENAREAHEEKWLGTSKQLKINGYAIQDNYETVDLFISLFYDEHDIPRVPKADVDQAEKRITNFFRKAFYNDFVNDIEESSPIFQFAYSLATYKELREKLVRVNIIILTNGKYSGVAPETIEISGLKIYYTIKDINRLYEISSTAHSAIELYFSKENYKVPCLKAPIVNDDYEAYVAVVPGVVLANLYERYGSRLLQQNVRSFLQFTAKINKGIRETIIKVPHMFLAYNNGITATADHIELDSQGRHIIYIRNLQIVNGGQTTASIFHTWKKDKADIENIFVQMKLSVIKKEEEFDSIVSDISRFANTQNKVNEADFSANNPTLIELEKMSRKSYTPTTVTRNYQTIWFFERARGQYKNQRIKEGFTKSRRDKFDLQYPKKQVFTKTDLAKYINAYGEVYDGKKLVIGPHIVVRGNEKNYAQYINANLPVKVTAVYFEDLIAKFILFRTAEKRYGIGSQEFKIGEMRVSVVPYTISLLTYLTEECIDLAKIWNNQAISTDLSNCLYDLMSQVNAFIIKNSPSSHYIEWAKKEECWVAIKAHNWAFDKDSIKGDLTTPTKINKRKSVTDDIDFDTIQIEQELSILKSIPPMLWTKIEEWGRITDILSIQQQSFAGYDMKFKLKNNKPISDSDRKKAIQIFNIVLEHNPELLGEADDLAEKSTPKQSVTVSNQSTITIEIIKKMVEWDKHQRILEDWQWNTMKAIIDGKLPLSEKYIYACHKNLEKLVECGFEFEK